MKDRVVCVPRKELNSSDASATLLAISLPLVTEVRPINVRDLRLKDLEDNFSVNLYCIITHLTEHDSRILRKTRV